jgi:lantibiotic modifying enzyme
MVAEVEAAVRGLLAAGLRGPDHLCCGSLGRAEILAVAGTRLGRPEWVETARLWTARVLRRAVDRGHFHLNGDASNDPWAPGFFQGLSGVGYHALRTLCPGELPCVLLLE